MAIERVDIKSKFLVYFLASIVLMLFALFPTSIHAESKKAFKLLDKGDYVKLVELLQKSIEKDSTNAGAKYVYSLLFLTPKYPGYNIDTSYYFINEPIADFKIHDEKDIENLDKLEINDSTLHKQKLEVESRAFRRAKAKYTIDDYNY
ncbi:MAG: hypothetical protein KAI29_07835, partial [Cyclobacteriaceae bacterium]|nr:hypothetical protein [Cyclobacteriaceae bacterium]